MFLKRTNKSTLFLIAALAGLALIYWRWFLPFSHVASDLHVTIQSELEDQLALPSLWGSEGAVGLGEESTYVIWNWPMEVLFGLFGTFGFSHSFVNQFFALFIGLLVGFYGMFRLLSRYKLSLTAKYIAGLSYLVNSYILLLVDGGQLTIALAYFYMPLAYTLTIDAVDGGTVKRIRAALIITLIGIFDIRFIYILGILIVVKVLYAVIFIKFGRKKLELLLEWFKLGSFIGLIVILLNAYWILPALITRGQALPATYGRITQTSFLDFTTLGHSFFLQQPHWYTNVFGKVSGLKLEFILVPILAFLPLLFTRKNRVIGFWLLVALLSVFLAKGASGPFPSFYNALFSYVPGFSLFRDSTKFFFLVSISYSVLIGFTVDGVTKWLRKVNVGSKFIRAYVLNPKTFFMLIIAYCLLLVRPVWLGKMTGTFSPPIYQNEFKETNSLIEKDTSFGRVFWIPTKAPLGYSSSDHPSVEASRFSEKRPFAIGTVGTYEIFNFLRESPFMDELFDIAGIKYIAYPYPDTRREELKEDNIDYYYAFLDQLTKLPWIEDKITEPPVPLLEVESSQDHFFIAQNTYYVVGSDRIYWDLVNIPDFKLSNNALIFAEEKPSLGNEIEKIPNAKIILYEKNKLGLDATFIDKSKFIFPAQFLDFDPDQSGWWKRDSTDFIRWRNFLQQKYGIDSLDFDFGGGWAVSEGNKELRIRNKELTSGNVLLARLMESGRGGRVEFYQGEQKIGEISTRIENPDKVEVKLAGYQEIPDQNFLYDKADFGWFEVGRLSSDQPLIIKTNGDINVINALVSIPEGEFNRIDDSNHRYNLVRWKDLSDIEKSELFNSENKPKITYRRFSPTHYKVNVKGLEKPATLAFSETYDSLWEMSGKSSYPLYSLINGFVVNEDGEYDVYFSPQKYVYPGLIISGVTLFIVIGFLVVFRKKYKAN